MSQEKLQELFARCWKDESFKDRFLAEPAKVLDENGFEVPEDVKVNVIENKPGELNIVLPINPQTFELSDDDLDQVAGGGIKKFAFRKQRFILPTKTQGKECVPW